MEFLNRQWLEYTGLSHAETIDWGYQRAFHPDDLASGLDKCRQLFLGDGPGESSVRLRRYDGTYRWFLIRVEPFRDETGQIIRWYGTSTDIEALKQTEERLRRIRSCNHFVVAHRHICTRKLEIRNAPPHAAAGFNTLSRPRRCTVTGCNKEVQSPLVVRHLCRVGWNAQ